jgi:hypothetical protein
MSMLDKVVAAVTPPESAQARAEARAQARAAAQPGDWLTLLLDHHLQIEQAFADVASASGAGPRRMAQKKLALILTAHSIAEENVIYPAMADAGETGHAEKAYFEQSNAKMQMALLDDLDPESPDYMDKLEHIRGAVAHHVYEEEGTWFGELQRSVDSTRSGKLAARYTEEFERYFNGAVA